MPSFCLHSLAFSDRNIRGFPFVFLTVNSSFRSIIRPFSTTVNSRKTTRFTGVHCMVNVSKPDCFPLFYGRFLVTKQRIHWCVRGFSVSSCRFVVSSCVAVCIRSKVCRTVSENSVWFPLSSIMLRKQLMSDNLLARLDWSDVSNFSWTSLNLLRIWQNSEAFAYLFPAIFHYRIRPKRLRSRNFWLFVWG